MKPKKIEPGNWYKIYDGVYTDALAGTNYVVFCIGVDAASGKGVFADRWGSQHQFAPADIDHWIPARGEKAMFWDGAGEGAGEPVELTFNAYVPGANYPFYTIDDIAFQHCKPIEPTLEKGIKYSPSPLNIVKDIRLIDRRVSGLETRVEALEKLVIRLRDFLKGDE